MKKHCLTNKHNFFSNLIINEYIVGEFKHEKIKEIILPYLNNHNKNFERFTVRLDWLKDNVIKDAVNIPNMMILQKCYKRGLQDDGEEILSLVTCDVYLSEFHDMMTEKSDEVHIIFTSDLRDITFFHYMQQPKSMLVRRLIGIYLKGKKENFDYHWLPKCFRHINT